MNNGNPRCHVGVVASMKRGLEQFIYRELCHLEQQGARISLFPTKQGPGLYSPRSSWRVCSWSLLRLVLAQPFVFLSRPHRYVAALLCALRYGALPDFLLAACHARHATGVDTIYCTFGDRKLFVGYFCKLLTGKPLVCTVHAYELYDNPNPALFRIALAACDRLITISKYNRQRLQQLWGCDPNRVEVITYSIDLAEYRPRTRFVILIVGFFVPRKGHDILFQAIQRLQNDDLEVWVVGGDGAESRRADVRQLAEKYGIESQVAFFGKLSGTALRAVYRQCDLFCLPCHFDEAGVGEGFPNVIIEAMACGKPVITTRHAGIPEILPEVLVDEQDVAGLAAAIQRLYESPSLREELGQRNRALAEQHFAPVNVHRTARILEQLAATA